jgi:hypothetical protein
MLVSGREGDVFFESARELLRFVGCDNAMQCDNCLLLLLQRRASVDDFHESRDLGVYGNLRHVSFNLSALPVDDCVN